MRKIQIALIFILTFTQLCLSQLSFSADTPPPRTQITWLGHAAFEIRTPQGCVLLIDPWLKNPLNPDMVLGKNPIDSIKKADYIFVTHGHSDHVGNAVEIAKKTQAKLVTNFELGQNMIQLLGFPKSQTGMDTLINIGGEIELERCGLKIAMTPAVHSSGIEDPKSHTHVYGGNPAGFVIQIKNGPTLYHTGDTAYFKDMELIGEHYSPDLALINIGGHFGMSPEMAIKAAVAVHAKTVVPHHYKTFPILTQSADSFAQGITKQGINAQVLSPGDTLTYENKELKK